ncbi:hypothetical protein [Chenggangzhangella methanolivorans]|uniref:Carboxypeptidase regulatory-like domain-containing protein n=1 Tax=Chenggangzhangella methanolivorans TaxID=1437009 RepID=A0A9E6UP60_9HYPH|nr:hypothetical protein [Chenggangzhangella methanolivorans]QZO01039.1 hypothetical protein K6K41_05460 [Chenggangzhangella methanolivorans]
MKLLAFLLCVAALAGAGSALAEESEAPAKPQIDMRGSWIGTINRLSQRFSITQQVDGKLTGFGDYGLYSWGLDGVLKGRKVTMAWPYNEVKYTVALTGKVDRKGRKIIEGLWEDTNGVSGTWVGARSGGTDSLVIRGKVSKARRGGATVTLAMREAGVVSAVQQVKPDEQGKYEFYLDGPGAYQVEGSLGYCVAQSSPCERQSALFELVDSGKRTERVETLNFVQEAR